MVELLSFSCLFTFEIVDCVYLYCTVYVCTVRGRDHLPLPDLNCLCKWCKSLWVVEGSSKGPFYNVQKGFCSNLDGILIIGG